MRGCGGEEGDVVVGSLGEDGSVVVRGGGGGGGVDVESCG